MGYFTSRNLVLLALVQIVVLVAAILGASAAHKWHTTFRAFEPAWTQILMGYGWLGLLLPVAWLTLALCAFADKRMSENARFWAVYSGFLLLILFLVAAWLGAIWPLLRLMGVG